VTEGTTDFRDFRTSEEANKEKVSRKRIKERRGDEESRNEENVRNRVGR